jgi:predicted SnoaL-like aldol condensation-catalyzing enzyme
MGTPEENKRLVLRQIEALNAGDAAALTWLAHPDFFEHEGRRSSRGRLEPLDIVAEGDRVVVRARVSRGRGQEIHIWRLADGRIVEHWMGSDDPDTRRKEAR